MILDPLNRVLPEKFKFENSKKIIYWVFENNNKSKTSEPKKEICKNTKLFGEVLTE